MSVSMPTKTPLETPRAGRTRQVLLLNGPNLNLLGTREPAVYGATTLAQVEAMFTAEAKALGFEAECFQSNHEGALIDRIQQAGFACKAGTLVGAVFNPGAYTHTSVALHDAIKGVDLPVVEIHISNVHQREAFRHHSFISPAAAGIVIGLGIDGYLLALRGLLKKQAAI
jgi:3-dehydroquinate dehydratase II